MSLELNGRKLRPFILDFTKGADSEQALVELALFDELHDYRGRDQFRTGTKE